MRSAVLYLNQFFGQIGGEEKADLPPKLFDKPVGSGVLINQELNIDISHTIVCGDNYMGSDIDTAVDKIIHLIKSLDFDFFLAGPAFQAGRYGVACGAVCKAVSEQLGKEVITSMHKENPGVDLYKKHVYIMEGSGSAARMRNDVKLMTGFANKLLAGGKSEGAYKEHYFPRNIRHQIVSDSIKPAAERAVDMLVAKANENEYISELLLPESESVPIAPPIADLRDATIALVTSGGIVPRDNPDRIQSASATRWGRYDISDITALSNKEYKTIHAGYDPKEADSNPNVVAPVDALKDLEKEGKFKRLHGYYYSTVGTGTTVAEASRMAKEIVPFLKEDKVNGIVLTST